jgi:SAM-dependent methyltransferase
MSLYDQIGATYSKTRREEPRFMAVILDALGDARSVVNVGAGTGNYEPRDLEVIAIEPSAVMIAQRPRNAARAIQATAERLPLADESVDAALAVFSDQHWTDRERGLSEMLRVARRRVVALTWDRLFWDRFWLVRDYLGSIWDPAFRPEPNLLEAAGSRYHTRERVVLTPCDCIDGVFQAYWRRPDAYLDPVVRAGTSVFAQISPDRLAEALGRLAADIESGAWQQRNHELLTRDELDTGYRLLTIERNPDGTWPRRADNDPTLGGVPAFG